VSWWRWAGATKCTIRGKVSLAQFGGGSWQSVWRDRNPRRPIRAADRRWRRGRRSSAFGCRPRCLLASTNGPRDRMIDQSGPTPCGNWSSAHCHLVAHEANLCRFTAANPSSKLAMSASRSADRWHEDQADLPAGMAYFISTLRSARAVRLVHLCSALARRKRDSGVRGMHMSARNSGATTRSRSLCRPSLGMAGFRAEVGRMASR